MRCAGSGEKALKKESWNIRDKRMAWNRSTEGWRTNCPVCGKVCAVGPATKLIQAHQPAKSTAKRMSAAERVLRESVTRDLIYMNVYDLGLQGETARPNTPTDFEFREVWEMAYLDGLSDGGHTMKIGAFKRWLAKN